MPGYNWRVLIGFLEHFKNRPSQILDCNLTNVIHSVINMENILLCLLSLCQNIIYLFSVTVSNKNLMLSYCTLLCLVICVIYNINIHKLSVHTTNFLFLKRPKLLFFLKNKMKHMEQFENYDTYWAFMCCCRISYDQLLIIFW